MSTPVATRNPEHNYHCGRYASGDRGQRFEIRGARDSDGEDIALGWATSDHAAHGMADAFRLWPYLRQHSVWVRDRAMPPQPGQPREPEPA